MKKLAVIISIASLFSITSFAGGNSANCENKIAGNIWDAPVLNAKTVVKDKKETR
ncbi:MAG: hypothetical protein AB8E15_00535 [Bdellovibrionales bacterium]